ncbi:unnamed protein product [Effrenium voratum]|nr:unnamed protein product [Effrenium voratum]
MTAVQNDMAWRNQMITEVQPLDRSPTSSSELKYLCRNPLSWNYGTIVRSRAASSKTTSSSFRSVGYSSLSKSRSSALSSELEGERKIREAMEQEVAELRAKLERADPSRMPPAGIASKIKLNSTKPCWSQLTDRSEAQ